jgi:hypothetical protein
VGRQTLVRQVIAKQAFGAVGVFHAGFEFDAKLAKFAAAIDVRLALVKLVVFASFARFRTVIVGRTIHCRD